MKPKILSNIWLVKADDKIIFNFSVFGRLEFYMIKFLIWNWNKRGSKLQPASHLSPVYNAIRITVFAYFDRFGTQNVVQLHSSFHLIFQQKSF